MPLGRNRGTPRQSRPSGGALVAIFGPTAVGKTGVALALADVLRERGEDPVAIGCDALQVYAGMEVLTGAATPAERERLEHRLIGFAPLGEEFTAGRFARLAHDEIDAARSTGRRPILVGGTGLYLRAAVSELDLRAPVSAEVRSAVESDVAERGPEALHSELPEEDRSRIHPRDRKRIARATELRREGSALPVDSSPLWTERPRIPTVLVGLMSVRDTLRERISARVEAMAVAGAGEEARAVLQTGSRTARAAIGVEAFAEGDLEAVKQAHWRYARRQLTWMRKLEGIEVIDRSDLTDDDAAHRIAALLSD